MGTSLQVAPVSYIPNMVQCRRITFNMESVLKYRKQDLFIQGDCDSNVEKLCSRLGWIEELLEHNAKVIITPKLEQKSPEEEKQ